MPLARILTLDSGDATSLYHQLCNLGFDVEVASPNEEHLPPADLEIELAICDQQQVLARAGAIAAQLQAEVVVFPRAIPPVPRPVPATEIPLSVCEPLQAQLPEHPGHGSDLVPAAELLNQEASESWQTKVTAWLRKAGAQVVAAGNALAMAANRGFQHARPAVTRGLAKLRSGTSSAGNAVADRTRGYQERIKVRTGEARAARQRRLAEMERLRAEAREQLSALERARMATEAEHQRLQQETVEEPVIQRSLNPFRTQPSQLKGVFTGAAATAVLFIAGMLLANFRPIAPLPVNMTTNSPEQQVPFGAATVQGPPGVTLSGAKAPTVTPSRASAAVAPPRSKPAPIVRRPSPEQTSQWRHFRRRSNAEDDATAEDVVVKHFGRQKGPQKTVAKNTTQQSGVRHYSDQ